MDDSAKRAALMKRQPNLRFLRDRAPSLLE